MKKPLYIIIILFTFFLLFSINADVLEEETTDNDNLLGEYLTEINIRRLSYYDLVEMAKNRCDSMFCVNLYLTRAAEIGTVPNPLLSFTQTDTENNFQCTVVKVSNTSVKRKKHFDLAKSEIKEHIENGYFEDAKIKINTIAKFSQTLYQCIGNVFYDGIPCNLDHKSKDTAKADKMKFDAYKKVVGTTLELGAYVDYMRGEYPDKL